MLKRVYGGNFEKPEVTEEKYFEFERTFNYNYGEKANQPEQSFLFTPDIENLKFALICRNPAERLRSKKHKQYGIDDNHAAFRMYSISPYQEMEVVRGFTWGNSSTNLVRLLVGGGRNVDDNVFGVDVDSNQVITPNLILELEVVNKEDYGLS